MFTKTSEKIAQKLKQNDTIDDEHYEICRYGLQQGLSVLLNIVTTILIGIMLNMLWQAILFTVLYIPLRSNAGGYHASTAMRCYISSVFMMIAVLLAMKYLVIPKFICIIALMISCALIYILVPVEDVNKQLDEMEQVVYKRRTYIITALEIIIFFVSLFFGARRISLCIMWVFVMMSGILLAGKYKNGLNRVSGNVHETERNN